MQVRPGIREPLDPVFAFLLMESSQEAWIRPSLGIAHGTLTDGRYLPGGGFGRIPGRLSRKGDQ
ncbi:MAG: hypothetical protein LW720_07605 [Pirellula sp.]|jgi:hypothetical protein|nr:hypothetical protein [Pirellula sp.]